MQSPARIPNIGPNERMRRRRFGLVALAGAAALLVLLVALDAKRAWRLVVAPPLWLGALGTLQHRGKT